MSGKQLFDKFSASDLSGSEKYEYAQTIQKLHLHAGFNDDEELFYSLLENAEKEGKKLVPPDYGEAEPDGYPIADFILVHSLAYPCTIQDNIS